MTERYAYWNIIRKTPTSIHALKANWTGFDLGSTEFNSSATVLQIPVDESLCPHDHYKLYKLPPPQAFPGVRSVRAGDERKAREGYDGNERRALAGKTGTQATGDEAVQKVKVQSRQT